MSDAILFWNCVALEANRASHTNGAGEQTGPPLSSRALAIVHLGMYDAYAAVVKDAANLPPYWAVIEAPPAGADAQAAVAGAAHATLTSLFPSQKPSFDARISGAPGMSTTTAAVSFDFGVRVGERLLADRANDPTASSSGYMGALSRGHHRPDPDNPGQDFHAPYYGARSRGLAITKRHELVKPPLDDKEYLAALRQVRGRGIAPELLGTLPPGSEKRSAEEALIGVYWGYDGSVELGTPPRLYNQIVRQVAEKQGNSEVKNARLFALINVAMADAGILAWDQKYIHDLWRPVLGIREQDPSMGTSGVPANSISPDADPAWLPLGAPATNSMKAGVVKKNFTPNFPAYPSGHATFGAAALHVTRRFYGIDADDKAKDKLFAGLNFVSEEFNGANRDNRGAIRPRHARSFPEGLWQMILENGLSRVYLGVHWVFDAFAVKGNGHPDFTKQKGGVLLGLTIANDIYDSGMKKSPVGPRQTAVGVGSSKD